MGGQEVRSQQDSAALNSSAVDTGPQATRPLPVTLLSQDQYFNLLAYLRQVAGAYPDPNSGANTAVSSALLTKFVQVFVLPETRSKLVRFEPQHYLTPYKGKPFPRPPAEEAREAGVPPSIAKAPTATD